MIMARPRTKPVSDVHAYRATIENNNAKIQHLLNGYGRPTDDTALEYIVYLDEMLLERIRRLYPQITFERTSPGNGGFRPGAGRKPKDVIKKSVSLPLELEQYARLVGRGNCSRGIVIALRAYMESKKEK